MAITDAGESRAWEELSAREPASVCRRAGAALDPGGAVYLVPSFGRRFSVDPAARRIESLEPEGEPLLSRFGYFFRLSVLWYLVKASDATPAGRLVKPSGLPGGDIFFKGSHVLPLEALAARYGADPQGFLAAGARLGGKPVGHGDAAVELPAFPKVPATLILWTADEEFPARADLLFDDSAPAHLPLDILWSIAMLSVLLVQAARVDGGASR